MKKLPILWLLLVMALPMAPAGAIAVSPGPISVSTAVDLALSGNPAIFQADANIQAAKAGVKSARADLLPAASLTYGYTGLKETPIMRYMGAELQTAHTNQYNWNATVVQPLFAGFALSAGLDMAKLDITARRLEKEQVVLDLTRNVKSACYNLLLAKRLLEVSSEEVAALKAHKRDAELFFREGLIRPNDLLQAEVALANSVQQQQTAGARVQKARTLLNRLLNRPLQNALEIQEVDRGALAAAYDPAALGERALEQRPLMQLLAVGLKQLDLSVTLARSAWFPTVSLVGQYAQHGDNPDATGNDYTNTHNASITVQARWNFFQSGKTRAEVSRARHKIEAFNAGIENYRNQVREEVRNAVLDCQVARQNIDTALAALDQARENWRITDLQYKEQVATATDVLDARTFLTRADTNYARAVYGFMDALAGLDRAVGEAAVSRRETL